MPDVEKIEKSLREHNISEEMICKILEGDDVISLTSKKQEKAKHLLNIINRMDKNLEIDLRNQIMDWCACCKTGQRDKDCKKYGKLNKDKLLSEKVAGLASIKYIGTGKPRINNDGTISAGVYWEVAGEYQCPCSCINDIHLKEAVSITYCHCCAGHFRYHLQNALKVKLQTKEVVSSALNSKGKKPCEFVYEVVK